MKAAVRQLRLHIEEHLHDDKNAGAAAGMRQKFFESPSFLTAVLKVTSLPAKFTHKIGYTRVVFDSGVCTFANERMFHTMEPVYV